jgi:hypothetical protein
MRSPTMAWSLIAEPVDPLVEGERLAYRRAYAEHFENAITDGISEGSLPRQNTRLSATCLVGAISESLVGPLSPTQQGVVEAFTDAQKNTLIEPIIGFCLQGLTGERR